MEKSEIATWKAGTFRNFCRNSLYAVGIQGPRIEAPYGLSSFCPGDKNLTKNLGIVYVFVIVVSHLFKNLQQET
ncbi:hypothetical protein AVEN_112193-1 [Araneus ventricosus]|uniref:Uncharacterized protein n=1 Tax=Araneus ventricosus TaxID=182803 RepID=A0A4Y2G2G4_ARAVE|nr:hypothetical protein AVEN_112193-1 [Araneus ventricosus]